MSGVQVRAGWWRQRCGHVVRVIEREKPNGGHQRYCFTDMLNETYRSDGHTTDAGAQPDDLVEFLGERIVIGKPDADPLGTIRAIVHDVPEASRMDVVWELRRLEEWLCRQMQEDTE